MAEQNFIREFISSEGQSVERNHGGNAEIKPTRMIIEDASSVSAKILVPQLGTDRNMLAQGVVDVRRFTNVSEVDVIWLTWFSNIPAEWGGTWAKAFCMEYANWRYSVGGENKKIAVKMVEAISGGKKSEEDKPKKKGILDRLGFGKRDQSE